MIGKKSCIVALIALSLGRLSCQNVGKPISESEVVTATTMSALVNLASVGECFLSKEAYFPYLFLGTVSLQNIPSLVYGSRGDIGNYGLQLGFDGLYLAEGLGLGNGAVSPVLFNFAHKYSMFGTYAAYTDLRSRTENPNYNQVIRYSFADLVTAPFDPGCYAHWSVLGYLGVKMLITGAEMALADQSNSVWKRGTSYIGDTNFPTWAGVAIMIALQVPNFIMTGVGEESLFRGTYYEELSYRLGEWPAKITDALYFTVCHYPQQWDKIMAENPGELALNTGLSMLDAFWLQYIYRARGLRAAVATHATVDIMAFFCDWLLQGGVPNDAGFSINNKELSIAFTYRL